MNSRKILNGVLLDNRTTFTLTEFCRACRIEEALVVEMVNEGIIEPIGQQRSWCFPGESLVRAKRALRLVRDLRVNWPGAALALDLLDQLEKLEQTETTAVRRSDRGLTQ